MKVTFFKGLNLWLLLSFLSISGYAQNNPDAAHDFKSKLSSRYLLKHTEEQYAGLQYLEVRDTVGHLMPIFCA